MSFGSAFNWPVWGSRRNTAFCYTFYGNCLTKYSNRAAFESENCYHKRNESIAAANTEFDKGYKNLLSQIEGVKASINCGDIKDLKEQGLCFSNIVRIFICVLCYLSISIFYFKGKKPHRSIEDHRK